MDSDDDDGHPHRDTHATSDGHRNTHAASDGHRNHPTPIDDDEMQLMDQTPTPTGTNDLFSFSPLSTSSSSSLMIPVSSQPPPPAEVMDDFDTPIPSPPPTVDDDDMSAGNPPNPDPFWTEDLFTPESQLVEEGQADLGKMGSTQSDIYQWREGRDTTPTADTREKPLPLQSDSPVVRNLDDLTSSLSSTKQPLPQNLHNLIPALGVSTPKPSSGNAFHQQYPYLATSPPDQLRKQASLAAAAAAPVPPGSPSGASGTSTVTGTPSALGRYYLSASDPLHISKHPQGSISFPDPAMAQYHHPVIPQLSPLLKNRSGMMAGNPEASPTLSVASDETFIPALGTSPKTGMAGPAAVPAQNLFPPMSKVIPPVAAQPAPQQQRKAQGQTSTNAFAYAHNPRPGPGSHPGEMHTGTSPLAQIHQSFAGMSSGPLGSGQQPPRIKPDGTPVLGSPDVSGGADSISGSFGRHATTGGGVGNQHPQQQQQQQQHQRPLLRQGTADSFMSTSSEEEDLSSPMILPDTSLRASDRSAAQQVAATAGLDSPRFGNGTPATPRASAGGMVGASPRVGGATAGGVSAAGGPLFPPLSSVTKVRSNAFTPAKGTGGGGGGHSGHINASTANSKFTFQNPSSAPVFPPMSPSSSSSGESGDETTGGARRGNRGSGWRFRSKSPFVSASSSQVTAVSNEGDWQQDTMDGETQNGDQDAGGGGGGEGDGGQGKQTDDEWARYRAGSITIGGIGYGNGGHGDDESDEEDDRKRRRPDKTDKKLETSAPLTARNSTRRASKERPDRKIGAVPDQIRTGDESEEEDDDGEDDDDDDGDESGSLESEDGYQDAGNAVAGPFPGGNAVRPPAKRKFPKSSDDTRADGGSSGEAATTVTRTKKDGTVVRKKRKSAPAEEGDVFCDYVEPLPPHEKCTSHFHRTYDLARHRETIHARNEGRAVEAGKLKEDSAKLWIEFGRPQCSWPCPYPNCGQIFSRKDAMQRHLKTKRHEG